MVESYPQEQVYYPKELSWLAFNERVLQEAADKNNPIIERFRFLGIYSNNMDEFYRVRVADVRRKIIIQSNDENHVEVEKSKKLMELIQDKVSEMTENFNNIFQAVVKQLTKHNIYLVDQFQLAEKQIDWLREYFNNKVLLHIAPILVDKKVDLITRLNDLVTYYYVGIHRTDKSTKYAIIEIPTSKTPRFINLPHAKGDNRKQIILLDNVIQLFAEDIFRGFIEFESIECYSFKMTRDSEYSINDDIDDSYVDKMSDSMKQRLTAEPVRIIYDGSMPHDMVKALKKHLKHSSFEDLIAAGAIRNVKDFIDFPNVGRKNLENQQLNELSSASFTNYYTVFDAIKKQDILLYYPYHRFLHFTEFVRQAAFDPLVKHIRITMYRIAKNSRVVNSLIDAVDNGKSVTVVMELRARFDEEANIAWAKQMTDAGIRVVFGNPSFKIHTKICVVSRDEGDELVNYAHVGTGNFNEQTAKIYTDFSLFTCNQEIAQEVISVFDLILLPYHQRSFKHLMVSPLNSKTKILELIDQEIENANNGKPAEVSFKVNNLVDDEIIDKLYEASQHNVKVKGIVRGMCSLRPGIKGLSQNIKIISIVDRFLEHPRVMKFHNDGDPKIYLSSADWMYRNMRDRIEVGCPVYDPRLKKIISDILELQFRDTLKARIIDKNQVNGYVKRGNRKHLRSQIEIHNYLKNLEKVEDDRIKGSV